MMMLEQNLALQPAEIAGSTVATAFKGVLEALLAHEIISRDQLVDALGPTLGGADRPAFVCDDPERYRLELLARSDWD